MLCGTIVDGIGSLSPLEEGAEAVMQILAHRVLGPVEREFDTKSAVTLREVARGDHQLVSGKDLRETPEGCHQ